MLLVVTAKWFQLAVTCHKKLTTGFIDCQHQFMVQGVPELVDDEKVREFIQRTCKQDPVIFWWNQLGVQPREIDSYAPWILFANPVPNNRHP